MGVWRLVAVTGRGGWQRAVLPGSSDHLAVGHKADPAHRYPVSSGIL